MNKKFLTLSALLVIFSVRAFSQEVRGAYIFEANDVFNQPLPVEIRDTYTTSNMPWATSTYGRLLRLARKSTTYYDMGIDNYNNFFITRGGSSERIFSINPTGQIGVGTFYPTHKLSVYGSGNNDGVISIQSGDYSRFLLQADGNILHLGGTGLGSGPINIMNDGNVGIGTADPKGYKLAVNGNAIFTKIIVKNYGNWPDYVFSDAYKLPSLEETAQYIDERKHLPGIPAAKEIESADGLDVADMNRRLLQKVEELTLYLIEEHKKVKQLEAEVASLKK
jgi:hypothetical protein